MLYDCPLTIALAVLVDFPYGLMHLCFHHTPIVQSHAAIGSSKIGCLALQPQSPLLSVSLRRLLALSCVQNHLLSEP